MSARLWTLILTVAILFGACSSDSKDKTDDVTTAVDMVAEMKSDMVDNPDAPATDVPTVDVEPEVIEPARTCLDDQVESKDEFSFEGVDGPVEVIIDAWGVPHIFATTEKDLFYAQGFVVARYRFIQMHAMRAIASGVFGSSAAADADDLSNDVYMRILNLRGVAEEMWSEVDASGEPVGDMLLSFADGVNEYIAQVEAGNVDKPLEWPLVGEIGPWTPVDTLTIARLQSWDLSFDGRTDKVHNAARVAELQERWANSDIVGIIGDLHGLAPSTDAIVLDFDGARNAPIFDMAKSLAQPFYKRLPASYWKKVQKALASVEIHPGAFGTRDVGSNNWTVSGDLTADGVSLVANDTHLSLRNPPVFFEVHLNTARAGGDIDSAGVCFPGIPGVILGHNQVAAWGATVYYADATDVYTETVIFGDTPAVLFNNEEVPMVVRTETFLYNVLSSGPCEDWVNEFIAGTDYTVETTDDGCLLTVNVLEVPHHGPVIPESMTEVADGMGTALTWKWTGFEPSNEVQMLYELLRIKTPEEFIDAVSHFGVGAQNWVYGDVNGHIAYAAFCKIPVRQCLEEVEDTMYPSFLPYPGNGECEWNGMVPLEDLPQAIDPDRGYIFTANGDSLGYTLDGDPYNDETYQGYMFAPGLRVTRIKEHLAAKVAAGPVTIEDMQDIQADHHSPLGARLTPFVLAAITAANEAKAGVEGSDPMLAEFGDDEGLAAVAEYLGKWSFKAAAGALPDTSEAEAKDAIATAIFNAWAVHVSQEILGDKMESPYDIQFQVRFLFRLFEEPETLDTYNAELGDSLLWDNTTTEEVESRNYVILVAMQAALDFLANPDLVGVAAKGGFGTDDMSEWHWGKLHTLKMRHALGGKFNIPSDDTFPDGYPRNGDNFSVDAANAGLSDTTFTYGSGAAIRNVYIMDADNPHGQTSIPGGQDASVGRPHYADQFELWKVNQTHPLHTKVEDLVPDAESCFILESLSDDQ
jgi:penicillin G amidase